ncbi:MAG: hypothetical protein Q7S75_02995 [bacterium]|nr:hypothetical protein [bacterium]
MEVSVRSASGRYSVGTASALAVLLSALFVIFAFAPLALAVTVVSDDISENTVWTASQSPYVVQVPNALFHTFTVNPGVKLTIEPGVVVKFDGYNGMTINGTLRALGTIDQPIYFTSLADDAVGGDTDGAAVDPATGQWTHLEFANGSTGDFDHAVVRYGGQIIFFAVNTGVANNGGTVTIDHSHLSYNGFDGLAQFAGTTHVSNSEFDHHNIGIRSGYPGGGSLNIDASDIHDNDTGILSSTAGSVAIHDSQIHGNGIGVDNQAGESTIIDAASNWWGSATGPAHASNPEGTGDTVSDFVTFTPFLTADSSAPVVCTENCFSNVLFLPGIEASRLYRPDYSGGTDQLWEPNIDNDARDLFLTADGKSVRNDVYTKDVIDEKNVLPIGQGNIYKSFIAQMSELKTSGTIADWEAVPYDWRLSFDDILNNGNQLPDGRIYYSGDLEATSSPYIIQALRRLSESSKTGKVTIIAHSNGGLLVKALTQKLGDTETAKLIDKIIFVAVPQTGTPQAIGAILHGHDQGLPFDSLPLVLTPETARTLAENMPSAYNLLPSADYFTYVDNPVVTFDNSNILAEFRARYGNFIHSAEQLRNFITDTRRLASSSPNNLLYPSVGNATLLSRAETLHNTVDTWAPPQGVSLYEIAGWGEDTLATIEYTEGKETVCSNYAPSSSTCSNFITVPTILYDPKEVVEGDGTVVVPSALWTATSTGVAKYWVNLRDYGGTAFGTTINRKHADILEVPELRTFIKNILTNSTSTLPTFISSTQPAADQSGDNDKRLRFVLHSPLNLSATDNFGNTVNSATSTIPGSRFKRYGEVQVITVPRGTPITLNLDGYETGSFTLDMQEVDGNNVITASSTVSAIPSATSTTATIFFNDGTLQSASPLLIDYDGNGATDFSLKPEIGETLVFDITPPEATITFDTVSQKIKIIGTDNLSNTIVSTTATSSTITDEAGNTLEIILKKLKQEKKELKIEIQGLRYDGVSTGKLPKAVLEYKWSTDKTGKIKELEEKGAAGRLTIEGHYDAKKDVTKIEQSVKGEKGRNEKENKETLPGLVIIEIKTEKGSVHVAY